MTNPEVDAAGSADDHEKRDVLFVESLAKAIKVLEAFADAGEPMGIKELAEHCGVNRSAVQRFAHTWCELGYLQRTGGRRLALTHKMVERSYDFLSMNPLVSRATPHLIDARDRCGQNVNLSIQDDVDIVYLARLPSHRQQLSTLLPGRRLPAFCTSGGRAILACYPDEKVKQLLARSDLRQRTPHTETDPVALLDAVRHARQQGYAIIEHQVLMGEIAIGTAILGPRGEPVGAIHIAAQVEDLSNGNLDALVQQAIFTARAISLR
ncbi:MULTISPECIES: IclR family transcriptional regulator [Achromobacter]|uniref:IclR family transcriptional regulator n=1 Tax=Achromobacter sp. TaxID=134375 RepID=UPI002F93561C